MLSLSRLIVGWLTLFVIGTDLFVVSPLIPLIADDFRVGIQSAGLTVTTFAVGYVVAAPIFGHVADRIGRRTVLTWCLAAFAAANLLTAAAEYLPAMLAARLLCGIAAAGVTPSVYALAGKVAPAGRRGTWIAIVLTGLLSSLPLGATVGAMAGARSGWPTIFVVLAACGAGLTLLNRIVWPEINQPANISAPAADPIGAIAIVQRLAPTVAWSTALYGMYTYLGAGLTGMGYRSDLIVKIVFLYGAAAFFGALLGGRIADRWGPAFAIRLSLCGLGPCFVILGLAVDRDIAIPVALVITSAMAQIFFPAQQSLLLTEFPTRSATALAWNNCALFLGMVLGSLLGGQAMIAGGFAAVPPLSAALAIAGWALHRFQQPSTREPTNGMISVNPNQPGRDDQATSRHPSPGKAGKEECDAPAQTA